MHGSVIYHTRKLEIAMVSLDSIVWNNESCVEDVNDT